MDQEAVFTALHDSKILKFGSYQLKSGLVAPYYMNLRRLPLYPNLMSAIVDQTIARFLTNKSPLIRQQSIDNENSIINSSETDNSDEDDEVYTTGSEEDQSSNDSPPMGDSLASRNYIICGVPYGAIPLASLIAQKAKIPCLFERKEVKSYGDKQSLLEDFETETETETECKRRIILIEDVICSGESILDAVRNLERQNLIVEFVICIVDREENGINLLLEGAGIRVHSLYSIGNIMKVLEESGRISKDKYCEIKSWIAKNQFKTIGIDPTEREAKASL